jgi:putative ABC transport system permease protein
MNVVTRGIRNAFRNAIRTFSIVVILGLSVGLALAMLVARQAVNQKIASVKSSIGNTISVSPAGSRGFEGGGEPLTTDQIKKVSSLANVSSVLETLSDRLTTSDTNLQSAIEAGSLGQRASGNNGTGFTAPPEGFSGERSESSSDGSGSSTVTRTFTPPVTVTGVNSLAAASTYGGSTVSYTSGVPIDPTKDANIAVIGKALADKNNLKVGSTFTAYNTTITVKGIYDTGNTFSNGGLIMPLTTVQRLSGQTNDVNSATVTVNSVDNIDGVVTAVKSALGSSADVVSNQDTAKEAIAPLENVKSISMFSLIGALVAGAVIILLTMTMIVRERRREIGVMKAIGASNLKTMFQFVTESITLTVLGLAVGLAIGIAAANPITKMLVNNSSSSSTASQTAAGPGVGAIRGGFRRLGSENTTNIKNIETSVGWDIIGYGVGAAFAIAIVGSALPALFISKIRPAEVMRAE